MQDRANTREEERVDQTESSEGTTGRTEQAKEKAGQAREMAGERMSQAKEKMGETAGKARESMTQAADQGREGAASGLESASEAVHEQMETVQSQMGKITEKGESAAGMLRQASDYLRNAKGEDMWRDVTAFMRSNPSQTLAIGLVAGFVIGRAMRTGSVRSALSDGQSSSQRQSSEEQHQPAGEPQSSYGM